MAEENSRQELSESEEELLSFVLDHTDRWRDFRNANYLSDWEKYERIFRGQWDAQDKHRESERSRIISPATQQAVETRHAEVMEAIFGQGEFFDIKDDLEDGENIDVEKLKNQLKEDFAQDKIRKSIDQIELMAEIYGTGIGEIVISKENTYTPTTRPIEGTEQKAFGVTDGKRVAIKLHPVNPKNFLFDPNGTCIDDCMGVAIESYTSIHKIVEGITSGIYRNTDVSPLYESDELEPTQEETNFQDEKVVLLRYYGLVPREFLEGTEEDDFKLFDEDVDDGLEDYADMVEAIIVIANGSVLLKAEASPYMMKDRPVICYQDDTVPNRLLGRGTVEKSLNMQSGIDSSMRLYLDGLALTSVPMMAMDATRLPRGAKFKVQPGANFMTTGNPNEIMMPFKFGQSDGAAMQTSKEFERMLLMATGTVDSQGTVSQVSRDGNMDMATATLIKKYKRALVNRQEDFIIPLVKKSAWRRMQFDPERYPSRDVKFIPTATLGIIAREHEQKQMAFLIQTLGAQSPLTPVLMQGVLENSSLSNKEQMIKQMEEASKPDPEKQKMEQQHMQQQMALAQAQIEKEQSEVVKNQATAQKTQVETQLAPQIATAELEKIQAQSSLEQQKAQAQLVQEQARSTNDVAIERAQADNDMRVEKFKSELKSQTDLMIEENKADTQLTLAKMDADKDIAIAQLKNGEPNAIADLMDRINQPNPVVRIERARAESDMQVEQFKAQLEAQSQLIAQMNAEKDIAMAELRSGEQSAIAELVEKMNRPKAVIRDKSGRVIGIE